MNINVSLNKTLASHIKARVEGGGYSNVSEYIRDVLRNDLKLGTHTHDDYPYDYDYIEKIGQEAMEEYHRGETISANSIDSALDLLDDKE